jgi:hypothetical protein
VTTEAERERVLLALGARLVDRAAYSRANLALAAAAYDRLAAAAGAAADQVALLAAAVREALREGDR